MEKAKAAVSDFLSGDGKHQTSVDQETNPAVTEEHILPHQHENVTTAVDREVHKDHHYTTVQPITHKETLPEEHHHNIIPVEHKSVEHGGQDELKSALEKDAAQYQDTTTTHDTTHSQSTIPVVAGERVHHHVHEHVQPVIQKEVIQPHMVHTTIPIHETHTAAPVHHGTKVAPTKTMEEFMASGGKLEGSSTKELFGYDGCPETESSATKTGVSKTAAATAGVAGISAATSGGHETTTSSDPISRSQETTDSSAFGTATTSGMGGERAVGTETFDKSEPTSGTAAATTAATGTAAATAAATSSEPTATEKTTTTTDQPTYTEESKGGSMFGKDKTQTESESQPLVKDSLTKEQDIPKKEYESNTATTDENYKAAGVSTAATDRVNDEGAFGGPGSVPRSEAANTTTDPQFTSPVQSWHAGETHSNIAEDVHKAGQTHRSFIDKINPFKDSDGDGKKGFMS